MSTEKQDLVNKATECAVGSIDLATECAVGSSSSLTQNPSGQEHPEEQSQCEADAHGLDCFAHLLTLPDRIRLCSQLSSPFGLAVKLPSLDRVEKRAELHAALAVMAAAMVVTASNVGIQSYYASWLMERA